MTIQTLVLVNSALMLLVVAGLAAAVARVHRALAADPIESRDWGLDAGGVPSAPLPLELLDRAA